MTAKPSLQEMVEFVRREGQEYFETEGPEGKMYQAIADHLSQQPSAGASDESITADFQAWYKSLPYKGADENALLKDWLWQEVKRLRGQKQSAEGDHEAKIQDAAKDIDEYIGAYGFADITDSIASILRKHFPSPSAKGEQR